MLITACGIVASLVGAACVFWWWKNQQDTVIIYGVYVLTILVILWGHILTL